MANEARAGAGAGVLFDIFTRAGAGILALQRSQLTACAVFG